MKIAASSGSIQDQAADTLIVNLFADVKQPGGATGAVDKALNGAISELIANGDFSGKANQVAVLYPRGAIAAKRVIVVGLGQSGKFTPEAARRAAAAAIRQAQTLKAEHVATIAHGAGVGGLDPQTAAQATAEASLLTSYRYAAPKQQKEPIHKISSLTIVEINENKLTAVEKGVQIGIAIAEGAILARDLVNLPPNIATPSKLAEAAQTIADTYRLGITIGDRQWAEQHNMGAYLAVSKGAGEEPKFIILEHNHGRTDLETVVLVGKGITFDTGGISLKPADRMGAMKSDMGGAAAVLGAMKTIAALNLPLHVVGITPCAENMPDAHAYRPADVITASNGKTIEIISTDAEGRMVLADALVYAERYNPKVVVDLATLTGACVVALGQDVAAGLFSTHDNFRDQFVAAGTAVHERVWPLPLYEDYRETIDSPVADLLNSGGRFGGVGTAAVFLQEFTNYPWVHLDIAGMALTEKDKGYTPRGGTGYGVRLLVEFLRNWPSA